MESYSYIESGVIFAVKSREALNRLKIKSTDFAVHGQVLNFIVDYLDEYGKFPPDNLLIEKYTDLDQLSVGIDYDYLLDQLQKQVISRLAIKAIKAEEHSILDNPYQSIGRIINGLEQVSVQYDDEIVTYNINPQARLEEYQERKKLRASLKIIGIPTPIRTINRTGIGIRPGEVYSLFARPAVGKSWFALKVAAIAMQHEYKVLFFTPEMSIVDMSIRMDTVLGQMKGFNFTHDAIAGGTGLNEDKYSEFLTVTAKDKLLLFCDHAGGDKVSISVPYIASLVRKHKPSLIILDQMTQFVSGEKTSMYVEELNKLYYGVKKVCVHFGISAFVTHQANLGAADETRSPRIKDVYFGDSLHQASDVSMSMSKVADGNGIVLPQRRLYFQKVRNRKLPVESVIFDWVEDNGIFTEQKEKSR